MPTPIRMPEASLLIVTSRLRPGLDGGYTVATMQRARLLARHGARPSILTVDLHPDHDGFRRGFVEIGLADESTVMRNLLEEVRARPELLRGSPLLVAAPSTSAADAAAAGSCPAELDALGVPWRCVERTADGTIASTLFFDGAGAPLFRLPYVVAPDWWRTHEPIEVLGRDGAAVGRFAGFAGLYRSWVDAVVAEQPPGPVVVIAEARQVGELLVGVPGAHLVHTVHNAHTQPPHAWDSPMDATWSGWMESLEGYDAVVWLTERQRADVERRVGFGGPRSVVIPHPAEAPKMAGEPVPRDPRRAIVIARLAPQKRVEHAIRAWALVVARVPDARLEVYGDGARRADCEALIAELGLGASVRLLGYTPAAAEAAREAAMLVLTSDYEGQGLVVLEALARGCPVVAYDIAYGPGEMIEPGVTGALVEPGDIEGLAEAIVALLLDAEGLEARSSAARAWASAHGPSRTAAQWAELLERLLAAPPLALRSP